MLYERYNVEKHISLINIAHTTHFGLIIRMDVGCMHERQAFPTRFCLSSGVNIIFEESVYGNDMPEFLTDTRFVSLSVRYVERLQDI